MLSDVDLFGQPSAGAEIGPCGTWRYRLTRSWDSGLPRMCWIMLNPSTADAEQDDPTIRRCIDFTRRWGYGGLVVGNLYALRATDPAQLAAHPDPVGPENNEYLRAMAADSAMVVCAWGAHPMATRRSAQVRIMLAEAGVQLWCLGTTRSGAPRHPLYVPASTALVPWPRD